MLLEFFYNKILQIKEIKLYECFFQIRYKATLVHLQPRQMRFIVTELKDDMLLSSYQTYRLIRMFLVKQFTPLHILVQLHCAVERQNRVSSLTSMRRCTTKAEEIH